MIHESGAHSHFANLKLHDVELFDVKPSRQVMELHRKKRRCHLAFENFAKADVRSIIAVDTDDVFVVIGRNKKGESLDVVPMNVRDQ